VSIQKSGAPVSLVHAVAHGLLIAAQAKSFNLAHPLLRETPSCHIDAYKPEYR